jgi:hypothetical protein
MNSGPDDWLYGAGVGVTGFNLGDCLQLVRSTLTMHDELPCEPVIEAEPDVASLGLPADQVGVPAWRGIWFPAFNLRRPASG